MNKIVVSVMSLGGRLKSIIYFSLLGTSVNNITMHKGLDHIIDHVFLPPKLPPKNDSDATKSAAMMTAGASPPRTR